ncbi:cytochrome P450 [Xylariomycetidae sp. FL2044]|nr:cytochrome P450 [Xylariomycetidae sp. FL2044]
MALSSVLQPLNGKSVFYAVFGILAAYGVYHLFRVYGRLSHVPGPFWAKFTNWQRVLWVQTQRAHEIHQAAHEKYGPVVRFGPNMVSLADPEWITTLYPMRPGFPKSEFYAPLMPYTRQGGALPAVFTTRDEVLHKTMKSPVAPLFSLSNILTLEPHVDKTLQVLVNQWDSRFLDSRKTFDMADWLAYFAFDVMGTLTFSKRYGFLEQGRDVDGMLNTIWVFMKTAAPMTQIPWFDIVWYKNSFTSMFRRTNGSSILKIVGKHTSARLEARKSQVSGDSKYGSEERDMLSQFISLAAKNPDLPPWCVTAWTFSNVAAGSDSTAAVMKMVFYSLMAHPDTLHKLVGELVQAQRSNKDMMARRFPSWRDICDLPYLDACILEAIRLHPPFCLPFERVVPQGGVTIGHTFFEEGTVVGMSPYIINRHKPTFGEDSEIWNPDRWMGPKEEKQRREAAVLTFGAGKRICLGKQIALVELKKIVATLLLRYEFELLDPKRYTVQNSWFFRQHGIDVRLKRRSSKD